MPSEPNILQLEASAMQQAYRNTTHMSDAVDVVAKQYPHCETLILEGMWLAIDAYEDQAE